jgi:hypothetical protein
VDSLECGGANLNCARAVSKSQNTAQIADQKFNFIELLRDEIVIINSCYYCNKI